MPEQSKRPTRATAFYSNGLGFEALPKSKAGSSFLRSGLGIISKVQHTKKAVYSDTGITNCIGMVGNMVQLKQENNADSRIGCARWALQVDLSKYVEVRACKATFPLRWLGHGMIRWSRNSNSRNGSVIEWDGKSRNSYPIPMAQSWNHYFMGTDGNGLVNRGGISQYGSRWKLASKRYGRSTEGGTQARRRREQYEHDAT